MQAVLNFSGAEKQRVIGFLRGFEQLAKKTGFEEARCLIEGCTVTLYSSGKLLIQGSKAETAKQKILEDLKLEGGLILGIDETGRGEGFGPLVVAGVLADTNKMRELRDSKKTRNIEEKAKLAEANAIGTKIVEVSASEIDRLRASGKNLNAIEAEAMNEIISYFRKDFAGKKFRVIVDGNPLKGVDKEAEFLVKADDKEPVVGAASVIAKKARDESEDKDKENPGKQRCKVNYFILAKSPFKTSVAIARISAL